LTSDIIADVLKRELAGIPVRLEIRDWLPEWWKPLFRGLLAQAVIEAHAGNNRITHNLLLGKQGCPHCERAKTYLNEAGIDYEYRDVVTCPV
ncbi:MAG: glutaredoxin, partial [Mariprofundaceae bacterium]|nr:glutaredoxin [Mariprofundaceae bacterium]